mmetsp:Transcript_15256/g.33289  ORF Transcript_15256/g.33289 Transcript_15256/m.33289 type:complete len:94 (+) Transcript_15256:809-1090(+)
MAEGRWGRRVDSRRGNEGCCHSAGTLPRSRNLESFRGWAANGDDDGGFVPPPTWQIAQQLFRGVLMSNHSTMIKVGFWSHGRGVGEIDPHQRV